MAIYGIETPLFQCQNEECKSLLFEEVDVKSYLTDGKKVSSNTASKALRCVKCGKYHNINEDYDIIEQA